MKKEILMRPHVAIILLNWNGWKDTLECLESVFQINYHPFSVILVDNDSTDESLEKIREYCSGNLNIVNELKSMKIINITSGSAQKPINIKEFNEKEINQELTLKKSNRDNEKDNDNYNENNQKKGNNQKENDQEIFIIKNDSNHGFAGGNNIGIKFAQNCLNTDYILLLNNDTVVEKDFLDPLVEISEKDKNIGFVGPKTYFYHSYPEKIIQITGGGGIDLKKARTFQRGYQEKDNGQYNDSVDLGYIGGSCVLVKKEVLQKVGLLDENFFMYWEDTDWCYRGYKSGYKSVYQPESVIWHKHGASSKPCFELYYLSRNRVFFLKKNATSSEYKSFILNFFTKVFWMDLWYYLIHLKDLNRVSCYLKGLKDGFMLKV